MHSLIANLAVKRLAVLTCALLLSLFAAGCHRNNLTSGYGIGWVTLTTEQSEFTSYMVTVDSVTLVGKNVGTITAVGLPETVDFTKISNVAELWEGASIPNDTYTQATITVDYSSANISLLLNGKPVKATVVDPTGATPTTIAVTVNLDPVNSLVITPTYATTSAVPLALDFDMALSTTITVNATAGTVKAVVAPYFTVATSAMNQKPIRIRGPLVNTDVNLGTYSIFVRPFFDEVNSAGTLSLFSNASTVFTLDGSVYTGSSAGVAAMSQASTGSTMTSTLATFKPTKTPSATAGIFTPIYVVAGSTLEDFYTQGIEGEVIARSGDTLTIRGSTYINNAAETVLFQESPDNIIKIGPLTQVTRDGVPSLAGLNYNSIAVGQHIIARGQVTSVSSAGVITLDASAATATNTGSVRLMNTELYGSLVSAGSGTLTMNLQNINQYPASVYNFAGNGATTPSAASFVVNTGALPLGVTTPGDPLLIDGYVSPFGSAPPDFEALTAPATSAAPARLVAYWSGTGTSKPFSTLNASGFVLDLTNTSLESAYIYIGQEALYLKFQPANMQVLAMPPPANTTGLPAVFLPLFSIGNTLKNVSVYNTWGTLEALLAGSTLTTTPLLRLDARGSYDPATNTFTAETINFLN